MDWIDRIPTAGRIKLPPDPRAMSALGRSHTLQSALADLIDNSIDAKATRVSIRVVRQRGILRSLCVVDDGNGIGPSSIDSAMTVGGRRPYSKTDLGYFGVGLKAASLSQAQSLTVISRAPGHEVVGRRWQLDSSNQEFEVEIVEASFAEAQWARNWGIPQREHGTIIRWDNVYGFPTSDDATRIDRFVDHMFNTIANHIGLVLHRLIESRRITIAIDVEDVDDGSLGLPRKVDPINPFGYRVSGHPEYPKSLKFDRLGARAVFRCHIWPGRSNREEFRLGRNPVLSQGLYIYRRDRLLQPGDEWGGIAAPRRSLQLARVEVDIGTGSDRLFSMNAEKTKVNIGPLFSRAAEQARSADGARLFDYLAAAEATYKRSRKRKQVRQSMLPPAKGFTPSLKRAICEEVPLLDEGGLSIKWRTFPRAHQEFFEVDRPTRTLWLNDQYRAAILGGSRGSLNDAPILKALLYLLVGELFRGEYLGTRDKDNMALWQEILTAAAQDEPR